MRKLFLKLTPIVMVVLCCLLIGGVTTFAATYSETESNDSYATANSISLGNSYRGTIGNSNDKDYYKITPGSNGYIKLKFKHTHEDSSNGWNIYTYVYSDGEYKELSYTNVKLYDAETVSIPSIGAKAGGTYYIMVKNYSGITGKDYTLSTSFEASDYYEKELNNVYGTATNVSLGSAYIGNINNSNDKDYYKLTPNSNGYIKLQFKHTFEDSTNGWNIYTYE